jgi:hypothetical protein
MKRTLLAMLVTCAITVALRAQGRFEWWANQADGTSGYFDISEADFIARHGTVLYGFQISTPAFNYNTNNSLITPTYFEVSPSGDQIISLIPTYVGSPDFSTPVHHLFFDVSQIVEDTAGPFISHGSWHYTGSVPEPSALGLAGLGVAVMMISRRRRQPR